MLKIPSLGTETEGILELVVLASQLRLIGKLRANKRPSLSGMTPEVKFLYRQVTLNFLPLLQVLGLRACGAMHGLCSAGMELRAHT